MSGREAATAGKVARRRLVNPAPSMFAWVWGSRHRLRQLVISRALPECQICSDKPRRRTLRLRTDVEAGSRRCLGEVQLALVGKRSIILIGNGF
jgi:hypothetical protein